MNTIHLVIDGKIMLAYTVHGAHDMGAVVDKVKFTLDRLECIRGNGISPEHMNEIWERFVRIMEVKSGLDYGAVIARSKKPEVLIVRKAVVAAWDEVCGEQLQTLSLRVKRDHSSVLHLIDKCNEEGRFHADMRELHLLAIERLNKIIQQVTGTNIPEK